MGRRTENLGIRRTFSPCAVKILGASPALKRQSDAFCHFVAKTSQQRRFFKSNTKLRSFHLAIESRKIANVVRFSFGAKGRNQASKRCFLPLCGKNEPTAQVFKSNTKLRSFHLAIEPRKIANVVRFSFGAKGRNQASKRCFLPLCGKNKPTAQVSP